LPWKRLLLSGAGVTGGPFRLPAWSRINVEVCRFVPG
jgi:hypothetical protein